jgi:hypothetical protein
MTAAEVTKQLDDCAADFIFPMLDNGYVYPADVRLNLYRDEFHWLMIIEALGVNNPRTSGFDSFQNCLHVFGTELGRRPGTANEDFLYPIGGCPEAPLFEDEHEWFAREDASCLLIRGNKVNLDLTDATLVNKGIQLIEPPRVDPVAIMRSLIPEHRETLLASEDELKVRNPKQLPLWLRLEEWHHPDLAAGQKPSDSETFQMLAEAIEANDKSRYRPSKAPNTSWRNWPEGGTL